MLYINRVQTAGILPSNNLWLIYVGYVYLYVGMKLKYGYV